MFFFVSRPPLARLVRVNMVLVARDETALRENDRLVENYHVLCKVPCSTYVPIE